MSEVADISNWSGERVFNAFDVLFETDAALFIDVLTTMGADLYTSMELLELIDRAREEICSRVDAAKKAAREAVK